MHYEPYQGVTLTETGVPIALEIIRHHRLLERKLTDHLEYDWAGVHDQANRLEHQISSQFADRIAEQLGDLTVDPENWDESVALPDEVVRSVSTRSLT